MVPLKAGIAAMALALAVSGAVFVVSLLDRPAGPVAGEEAGAGVPEPLRRSDPGIEPRKEPAVAPVGAPEERREPAAGPEPEPAVEASYRPTPQPPPPEPKTGPKIESVRQPEPDPAPKPPPEPTPQPEPRPQSEPKLAPEPAPYRLPDGAVMALNVEALGLREVPVFGSTASWALKRGVGHDPDTSLPWTNSTHRNVYVAGHRVGFPDTASDRVFDRLGDLRRGDGVVLRGGDGERYRYEVAESFVVSPEDSWVTDRVRGEDLLTLQTCVGPNFSERLVVRAERVA